MALTRACLSILSLNGWPHSVCQWPIGPRSPLNVWPHWKWRQILPFLTLKQHRYLQKQQIMALSYRPNRKYYGQLTTLLTIERHWLNVVSLQQEVLLVAESLCRKIFTFLPHPQSIFVFPEQEWFHSLPSLCFLMQFTFAAPDSGPSVRLAWSNSSALSLP